MTSTKQVTVKIPQDLQAWFKVFAIRQYGSMQGFFNVILRSEYESDLKRQLELHELQAAVNHHLDTPHGT